MDSDSPKPKNGLQEETGFEEVRQGCATNLRYIYIYGLCSMHIYISEAIRFEIARFRQWFGQAAPADGLQSQLLAKDSDGTWGVWPEATEPLGLDKIRYIYIYK